MSEQAKRAEEVYNKLMGAAEDVEGDLVVIAAALQEAERRGVEKAAALFDDTECHQWHDYEIAEVIRSLLSEKEDA